MKKSFITGALVLLAGVSLLAGSVQAKTMKISHVRPQGTAIDKDLHWFSDTLKEASGGKLKTKIYPASALGDYTIVQERVSLGAISFACQPPSTAADKRFQLIYFPYIVENWQQAQANYGAGAPLRKVVEGLYAEQNIHMLAAWPVYFGGISFNKEVKNYGNPDAPKGLKLRVPPMKTFQLLADETGYLGTPIPFSDAFTAVQTGVVDGVIGSGAEGYYSSFRDVTKYYLPANTHFEVWYLIMSQKDFDKLSAEEQAQVQDAASKFEDRRWAVAEADQAANEKKLADYGAVILPITDAEIGAISKKAKTTVWPVILNDVGKEWGQSVLDKVSK
ncbi:TRAP transporter substrate-binding protein DctP [Desulfotalea psychrophila]|uniref:Probable DctP (Periplasmic C4-dicarboxylate binding protein) n=1 Tax=Desulfotalea psychrophila (strain LSv54 / DSM 12343) TaxID=177439 RepID=Q6AR12_DESPS|nr:TRAP transporter substrate-binding protein DctP [Desulfotalea psychrophila]CAG35212.1 probable DctP (periplasmic C4-dicarboxylate binding protein) [Desulfotalea psychrophila LSv54]